MIPEQLSWFTQTDTLRGLPNSIDGLKELGIYSAAVIAAFSPLVDYIKLQGLPARFPSGFIGPLKLASWLQQQGLNATLEVAAPIHIGTSVNTTYPRNRVKTLTHLGAILVRKLAEEIHPEPVEVLITTDPPVTPRTLGLYVTAAALIDTNSPPFRTVTKFAEHHANQTREGALESEAPDSNLINLLKPLAIAIASLPTQSTERAALTSAINSLRTLSPVEQSAATYCGAHPFVWRDTNFPPGVNGIVIYGSPETKMKLDNARVRIATTPPSDNPFTQIRQQILQRILQEGKDSPLWPLIFERKGEEARRHFTLPMKICRKPYYMAICFGPGGEPLVECEPSLKQIADGGINEALRWYEEKISVETNPASRNSLRDAMTDLIRVNNYFHQQRQSGKNTLTFQEFAQEVYREFENQQSMVNTAR